MSLKSNDEQLWKYYQSDNPTYLEQSSRDKVLNLLKIIKRHTNTNDLICEVGLGSGLMVRELARKNRQVIGVDICKNYIKQLQSNKAFVEIDLRHGNICQLNTICNSLNAVVSIDVIEHLTHDQLKEAFNAVYDALLPEGKWFINVPCDENLKINEIYCPHCYKTFHRVGHKQSFTPERLENLLTETGFQPILIKRHYFANFQLPVFLMWTYRMLARIYFQHTASIFAIGVKR